MIRRQPPIPAQSLPDRSASLGTATRAGTSTEAQVVDDRIQPSPTLDSMAAQAKTSGRLWDPLIGLSEREVEEWEQQGNSHAISRPHISHNPYPPPTREPRGVASIKSRNDALVRGV
jgi:hypothetical protein